MTPAATGTGLRQSPLAPLHRAAGARMVPFAGWEMPLEYEGIRAEHLAVRAGAGLFDVSHMGRIEVSGPLAAEFLRRFFSGDVSAIEEWHARYGFFLTETGGVLDDLIAYRLPDRFLLVVNASNADADLRHLMEGLVGFAGADVVDRSDDNAMVALQGPTAMAVLERAADGAHLAGLRRFAVVSCVLPWGECLVCRTGYTGEDGVEMLAPASGASTMWERLLAAGAVPAGLGARDTLRLEACLPLHGNELTLSRTPVEAGLAWACAPDREYIGAGAVRRRREEGAGEKLVALVFTGPGVPRAGCDVLLGGERVGEVTSGTFSPSLKIGVAMAYVRSSVARPGTEVGVDVRGKVRPARIVRKPIYRKEP